MGGPAYLFYTKKYFFSLLQRRTDIRNDFSSIQRICFLYFFLVQGRRETWTSTHICDMAHICIGDVLPKATQRRPRERGQNQGDMAYVQVSMYIDTRIVHTNNHNVQNAYAMYNAFSENVLGP